MLFSRKNLALSFIAIFILFGGNANAQVTNNQFFRQLAVGSSGTDVKYLQQVLNMDQRTQVASSGLGSPGFESLYFGLLTKQAVMRFQNLHSIPSTGFVGPLTLAALNNYVGQNNSSQNTSNSAPIAVIQSSPQDSLNSVYRDSVSIIPGSPYIDSISPKTVTNGDYITISGRYFSTTAPNTVSLSFNDVSATSTDGTTLRVQVKSYINDLFDQKMRGESAETRRKAIEKTSNIPIFVLVQNNGGASNPYMIYLKLK